MIASVYRLSRGDIAKLKVTDDYSIHRIVYSLFPAANGSESGRDFLYADKGGDFRERKILIISHRSPGEPEAGILESREIPASFLSHDQYAFEVVMNPTRRDSKTAKLIPVCDTDELTIWFSSKTNAWGFNVDEKRLAVSHVGIQCFDHKGDGMVTHSMATYTGILEVKDRPLFVESFEKGIGRCRGFGFGLLQVRPVEPAHDVQA
jgi:CRISPR system Cascade subunit CasE